MKRRSFLALLGLAPVLPTSTLTSEPVDALFNVFDVDFKKRIILDGAITAGNIASNAITAEVILAGGMQQETSIYASGVVMERSSADSAFTPFDSA